MARGGKLLKSTYNMGELCFKRFDKLFTLADEHAIYVRIMQTERIKMFYSILRQIWINLKPLIIDPNAKEKMEERLDEVKGMIKWASKGTGIPKPATELVDKLGKINEDLYLTAQIIGVSIPTEEELTGTQKLARALGV